MLGWRNTLWNVDIQHHWNGLLGTLYNGNQDELKINDKGEYVRAQNLLKLGHIQEIRIYEEEATRETKETMVV